MSILNSIQSRKKYGITEKKKAELDALTNEVLDAQHTVEQFQSMVDSLTEKSERFQEYLTEATATRDQAKNNKDLLDDVVQNVLSLKNNSSIAFDETVLANEKMEEVSIGMKNLINELIYSAEVINKLSNIIIKKKAKNPLISDELIDMVNTIGKDANNAVSLTLVALQATYAAEATSIESEGAAAMEFRQAVQLYEILTGREDSIEGNGTPDENRYEGCLEYLIDEAYTKAKQDYEKYYIANQEATDQLNTATILLNKAQVNLSSLQSGLAAANAAALAS